MKVCIEHGCPELTEVTRCDAHRSQYARAQGSSTERGYGQAHRKLRARWAPKVARGTVMCARCHERISPLEPWHLDHTDDRTGYLGPSHAACNVSRREVAPPPYGEGLPSTPEAATVVKGAPTSADQSTSIPD